MIRPILKVGAALLVVLMLARPRPLVGQAQATVQATARVIEARPSWEGVRLSRHAGMRIVPDQPASHGIRVTLARRERGVRGSAPGPGAGVLLVEVNYLGN